LMGYPVVAAEDGDTLRALVGATKSAEVPFTAVIADLRMPGCSVEQSFRWVREHWMDMPFIVVTGLARLEDDHWLRRENVPVLPKPIDLDRLASLIENR
jgi:DNA-binding NtrC family response regulator